MLAQIITRTHANLNINNIDCSMIANNNIPSGKKYTFPYTYPLEEKK
jgi:hypothetical protein